MTLVAAVAGRLVEPDKKGAAFPASAVPRVAAALRLLLERYEPVALVASAARGADLLALTAARALGVRCHVVLPFGIDEFRRTSVGDDPYWTRRFDEAIADAASRSDLVLLTPAASSHAAYRAATERILAEARALSTGGPEGVSVLAIVIWDGRDSGPDDHTAHFRTLARRAGCTIEDVSTST